MKKIYYIIPIAILLLVVGILIGINLMPTPEQATVFTQSVDHTASIKELELHQAEFNKAVGDFNLIKGHYKADFSDDGTGNLFKFYDTSETYWVSYGFDLIQTRAKNDKKKEKEWKLKDDLGYKSNTTNSITYEETDIEIIYTATDQQLKEDIVIAKDNAFKTTKKDKNYTFEVRGQLDYSNGLTPVIDGSGQLQLRDSVMTRFTFPRPFIIDADNTTVYLDYELVDKNLSIVIDYNDVKGLTYPITIDPTVVAGCTETATEVQCHSGTYSGNWINTTKNISIQSATIDGDGVGVGGEILLKSLNGGWIEILDSTIDGHGSGTCGNNGCAGQVQILTDGNLFINNSIIHGYSASSGISGASGTEGGGYCQVDVNDYIAYTGTNTYNCYGGTGSSASFFTRAGGSGTCYLRTGGLSADGSGDLNFEGTQSWNCYGGGSGRITGSGTTGAGYSGGSTTLQIKYTDMINPSSSTWSFNANGGGGNTCGGSTGSHQPSGGGNTNCDVFIYGTSDIDNLDLSCTGGSSGQASIGNSYGSGGTGDLYMELQNHTVYRSTWSGRAGARPKQASTTLYGTSNIDILAQEELNMVLSNSWDWYGDSSSSTVQFQSNVDKSRFGMFGLTTTAKEGINSTVTITGANLLVGNYTTQFFIFPAGSVFVGDEGYYMGVEVIQPADLIGSTTVPVEILTDNKTAPLSYCEFNITYQNGTLAQANTEIADCISTTGTVPSQDDYRIDVFANDTNGLRAFNNKTFSLDLTAPTVEFDPITPSTQGVFEIPYNITITYNITDPNINKCYWNATGEAGGEINCSANTFNIPMTHASQINISINASDIVNNSAYNSSSVEIIFVNATQWTDKTTITEGDTATFYLNITSEDIPTTTAILYYNNTGYPADGVDKVDSDNYAFDKALTIPVGSGNVSGYPQEWFWEFNIGSGAIIYNMTNDTQTVFAVDIDDCTAYSEVIANFTLKEEETDTIFTNATSSSIEVDWTLSSWADASVFWTYHTETPNKTLLLCVPTGVLNDTTFRIDAVASYEADAYVTEFWYLDNGTLDDTTNYNDHTTHTIELRDLALADSTTFLFTFINEFNIEEEGIIVHVDRYYIGDGTFREVERAKSDDNGETHVHLVQEDVIYRFRISKDSELIFTSENYNAKCLSQPCSLTLSAIGELSRFEEEFDRLEEGTYGITDDDVTREVELIFNLEEIDTMNLTVWKYSNVIQSPDEIVATDTVTAKTGTITVTVPASAGNQTYYATVQKGSVDPELVTSRWVDFSTRGFQFLGTTGILIAFLLVLTLGLMAVSSGAWTILFVIIALIISTILKVLDMNIYLLMYIVVAGLILIFKLVRRKSLD